MAAMERKASGGKNVGVCVIAFGKLMQALVVFAVGAGALLFVDRVSPDTLRRWVATVAPDLEGLRHMAEKLMFTSDRKLSIIGAVGLGYAAVFLVEAVGLWRQKTWAEYLTVVVTASYLPYEIYGLTNEVSIAKVITIVLNSAVVVFLIVRIVVDRRAHRKEH